MILRYHADILNTQVDTLSSTNKTRPYSTLKTIMSDRQGFDNYIMSCLRKYEENHPDVKLTAKRQITVSVDGCEYCQGKEDLLNIPFYLRVGIEKDELVVETNDTRRIKIHNCPMCGRKF